MKKLLLLLCFVAVIVATAVGPVHAATVATDVSCQGATCDGGGTTILDYVYVLQEVSTGSNLRYFSVGLLDDRSNITDVLSPQGWTYEIRSATDFTPQTDFAFTEHGQRAQGPWFNVLNEITWTAPGDGILPGDWWTLTFGFNDPNAPVDVTWRDNFSLGSTSPNVNVAGGAGVFTSGPVHTPAPEPSTIVLLIAGAISVLAYAWRRR